MLEAIERIEEYTHGMTFAEFQGNQKTIDAVIRNVAVIGEAASRVPDDVVSQIAEIPWAEMRGMRNLLIHEYFLVSLPILWHTVVENLPPLIPLLQRILTEDGVCSEG